jgi:hypothetical protein
VDAISVPSCPPVRAHPSRPGLALSLAAAVAVAGCAARGPVERLEPGRPRAFTFEWSGEADAVWVVGSMTGWERVPLAREGGGRFATSLSVPEGRHEYHLEVELGGVVRVVLPAGAERVDDGYGGENAVLRVGGR